MNGGERQPREPLDRGPLVERVRRLLGQRDRAAILLSHPESVAHVSGYEPPVEDYPVSTPFVADPPLVLLTAGEPILLVPDMFRDLVFGVSGRIETYRSFDVNV